MSVATPNGVSEGVEELDLDTSLAELTVRLRAHLDQLDAKRGDAVKQEEVRREGFRQELSRLDHQRTKIRRALKGLVDEEAPTKLGRPKVSKTKTRKTRKGTVDLIERAVRLIDIVAKEEFSVLDLFAADGGTDNSKAGHHYEMVKKLRSIEYLGRAGNDKETKRQLWRKLPNADQVLERLRATNG